MSQYRDRTGQRIGSLEVLSDWKRTKAGKVVWRCIDHRTGADRYLRTDQLIRMDRDQGRQDGASRRHFAEGSTASRETGWSDRMARGR
ncbi:hypothetical protein GCM10022242_19720 [Nocardioides panacisoli]|uniref:Transposase n=1 Tax=Nocardioides panacisoli TaxID=627624 RepID=A0ABP7IGN1_9ACTN